MTLDVVPPSMLDHARQTESGDQSLRAQTKGRLNGRTRPKTKIATHRWQNFIQNSRDAFDKYFDIFSLRTGDHHRKRRHEHANMFLRRFSRIRVTKIVFSDGELFVWDHLPGCWFAKWLPCFEAKTSTAGHTSLFPSFACLKGAA